jgi:hypothetical protein
MAERLMPAARAAVELAAVTPDDRVLDVLIATAGHVLAERERLEAEGRWRDLQALIGEQSHIELRYLLALARGGVRWKDGES